LALGEWYGLSGYGLFTSVVQQQQQLSGGEDDFILVGDV